MGEQKGGSTTRACEMGEHKWGSTTRACEMGDKKGRVTTGGLLYTSDAADE